MKEFKVKEYTFLLDDEDYDTVYKFGTWVIRKSPGGTISIYCRKKGDKSRKRHTLPSVILGSNQTRHIIHKDNNKFNFQKSNLCFGSATKKQASSSLIKCFQDEAHITDGLNYIATIDLDDVEKCAKHRWKYFEGRGVIGKINSKSIFLSTFLLNPEAKHHSILHKDGNKSNYKKSNLFLASPENVIEARLYRKKIIRRPNNYTIDGDITRIHLKIADICKDVLIDTEDLERIISLSRWSLHEVSETFDYKFYVVGTNYSKQIKLHRVVLGVNDPSILVDHINGNSLDNRKSNLRVSDSTKNNHNTIKTYGKSGDKNVYFIKNARFKWLVLFREKGKKVYSKNWAVLEDAIKDSKEKRSIYQPTSPEGTAVQFNLASFIPRSEVNGPGVRCVVWIGGCLRGCKNCFNPELWSFKPRNLISPELLADMIIGSGSPGFTFSGGDPLDSPIPTLRLLRALHSNGNLHPALKNGIILFTGFTIEEIEQNPLFKEIIALTDLTIEGRYIDELRIDSGLHGSSNQRFIWNESPNRGKNLINESQVIFDQAVEVHMDDVYPDIIKITGFPTIDRKFLKKHGLLIESEE